MANPIPSDNFGIPNFKFQISIMLPDPKTLADLFEFRAAKAWEFKDHALLVGMSLQSERFAEAARNWSAAASCIRHHFGLPKPDNLPVYPL